MDRKVFLVIRNDEVAEFVIVALDEQDARNYAAQRAGDEGRSFWQGDNVSVYELTANWPLGVVVRSFRAG